MHRLAVLRRSSSRSKYYHYFLPLRYPRLSSLPSTSPPLSGPAIFPLPRCSRLPPFSPSRTCVCARAPSDFFPVFTHRSFFPFRNIIGGAMHLSPFPSPPPLAPPLAPLARPLLPRKTVRPRSLAPRVRLRRILDACRQLANSRLPQTGSANRPISRREACSLTLKAASRASDCNIVVRESIIIKPLRYIFLESEWIGTKIILRIIY